MDQIEKQVRRARRRLSLQRFLSTLGWAWTITLGVSVLLILIGKFWPLGVLPMAWVAGAILLGLVAAWMWTFKGRPGTIDAAVEIDQRFGLKERVSSALALSETERETQAGAALVQDAARRIDRIDVSQRMRLSPNRGLLYPLVPGLIALLIIVLVHPSIDNSAAQAKANQAEVKKQVKKSTKKLQKRLAQQRKKAEKQGLKETEKVLKLIQQELKKLQAKPSADRRETLMKLNDLADQLKKHRRQAGGADRLKDQLKKMGKIGQGPADRLAKALKKGDFKQAIKELNKMRKDLTSSNLDDKQREQLAQQMEQMAQKLEQMAAAQSEAQERLENEIKKCRDAGQMEQANKLEEQLAKMREKLPSCDLLDKLAGQCKKCSQSCKNGKPGESDAAMQELADNLGQLQQNLDQQQMLDEALEEMNACRDGMCQGGKEGEDGQLCQGEGQPMFAGPGGLKPGVGHIPGGPRGPEVKGGFHDSQVRQEVRKGNMTIADYIDGPNRKGQVGQAIQEQLEAARHAEVDPMTDQQMPKKHRKHALEYLNRFREGK